MENLENTIKKCKWKESAEAQQKHELERLGHDKGCKGFYNFGCYACEGYNNKCKAYYSGKK